MRLLIALTYIAATAFGIGGVYATALDHIRATNAEHEAELWVQQAVFYDRAMAREGCFPPCLKFSVTVTTTSKVNGCD